MVKLAASAVAIVDADADMVYASLSDYDVGRREITTDEFSDYEVRRGGQGAGSEVHWTVAVHDVLRTRQRRFPRIVKWSTKRRSPRTRRSAKRPPWDCLIQVDESGVGKIVERDVNSSAVTTWELRGLQDSRTVVRVEVHWEHEGGYLARVGERVAVRVLHEAMLTRLQDKFRPGPPEGNGDIAAVEDTDHSPDGDGI
jgi:hypothetical protein